MRGRTPKLDGDNSFIHNARHYATARFPFGPSTLLSEIVRQNRLAINRAIDPDDIEIGMTVMREMVRRKQSMLICEPFERFYSVPDWSAAWEGLDFSAAIKKQEDVQKELPKLSLLVLGQSKMLKSPDRCKHAFSLSYYAQAKRRLSSQSQDLVQN